MPSPIGHGLAGLSIAWMLSAVRSSGIAPSSSPPRGRRSTGVSRAMLLSCAFLAALPDIDVLFGAHRGPTHSLGAVLIVTVCAWAFAARRGYSRSRVATASGLAYSSHLLLDWLGKDSAPPFGIMAFWPWSSAYYSSGANLFLEISRRYWKADEFIVGNLRSIAWELLLLLPIALLCYYMASIATATPFPPPKHNAAIPRRAPRRRSS